MRGLCLAVTAMTGCNAFYGLDETQLRYDARELDGPGCSDGVFVGPTLLPDPFFDDKPEFQSNVRHDLRELWFQTDINGWNIYVARRASPSEPWGPHEPAPFSVIGDEYASLSGDGLRIVFTSMRAGAKAVWEATRGSLDVPFGAQPAPLVGLADISPGAIDLSFDGKTLYYTEDDELWAIARPAFDQPFANPRRIGTGIAYMTVSPDGLEVFYNPTTGGTKLFRQTRGSTADSFGAPTLLRDGGEDPDLAANGTTLYLSLNGGLAVMERSCL